MKQLCSSEAQLFFPWSSNLIRLKSSQSATDEFRPIWSWCLVCHIVVSNDPQTAVDIVFRVIHVRRYLFHFQVHKIIDIQVLVCLLDCGDVWIFSVQSHSLVSLRNRLRLFSVFLIFSSNLSYLSVYFTVHFELFVLNRIQRFIVRSNSGSWLDFLIIVVNVASSHILWPLQVHIHWGKSF